MILASYSPEGRRESDTTETTYHAFNQQEWSFNQFNLVQYVTNVEWKYAKKTITRTIIKIICIFGLQGDQTSQS